jgi:hypothetical protein
MKTIEEAAMDHFFEIKGDYKKAFAHLNIFKAGVEFAQRWITVEEELPKVGVLVFAKDKDNLHRLLIFTGKFWIDNYGTIVLNITHWRKIEIE